MLLTRSVGRGGGPSKDFNLRNDIFSGLILGAKKGVGWLRLGSAPQVYFTQFYTSTGTGQLNN